jgi:hypothetical protein
MVSVLLVSNQFAVITILSGCLIVYVEAETKPRNTVYGWNAGRRL